MVGRLVTLVAVVASLVAFIAQVTGTHAAWADALGRTSYPLLVLGIVAALMAARSPSLLVVWLQVIATAAALAFGVVGMWKFFDHHADPYGGGYEAASVWLQEMFVLSVAVLAFGLTLARRRNPVAVVGLALGVAIALGCGIDGIVQLGSRNFEGFLWFSLATGGAFLAAGAAAGLERGGGVALYAPVPGSPGGDAGSGPGVE